MQKWIMDCNSHNKQLLLKSQADNQEGGSQTWWAGAAVFLCFARPPAPEDLEKLPAEDIWAPLGRSCFPLRAGARGLFALETFCWVEDKRSRRRGRGGGGVLTEGGRREGGGVLGPLPNRETLCALAKTRAFWTVSGPFGI